MKGLASVLTPRVRLITRAWVQGCWISSILLSPLSSFADFGFTPEDADKEVMYRISENLVFIDPVLFEPLIQQADDERMELTGLSYLTFNLSDNLISMDQSGKEETGLHQGYEMVVRTCHGFLDATLAKKVPADPNDPEDPNHSPVHSTRQYGYESLGRLDSGLWVFRLHYWGGWNGSPLETLAILRLSTRRIFNARLPEKESSTFRTIAVFELLGTIPLERSSEVEIKGDSVIVQWPVSYSKDPQSRIYDLSTLNHSTDPPDHQ